MSVSDVLAQTAVYVSLAVQWLWWLCGIVSLALGLWALVDCLSRRPEHFVAADKRTKMFWLGANAAGVAVVAFMGWASMLGLLGVVANAVYLADVRPALRYYAPVRVRSRVRRVRGEGDRGQGRRGGQHGGRR